MKDVVAQVASELLRRDSRHPDLRPGERWTIDYHTRPRRGDVVLVHRDGVFRLELAPAEGWTVGIVRLVPD